MAEKKQIYIVDDEFTIRELVSLTLQPDYKVTKIENGEKFGNEIDNAKKTNSLPDLIVLDVMMPKIDGYQICKEFKNDPKTKHIPIIMLTAKHREEDVKKAIEVNADEFISKPFEPDFLKKRVDSYFKPKKEGEIQKSKLLKLGRTFHYVKGDGVQK